MRWGCEDGAWGQPGEVWQVLGTVAAHGHGDGRPAVALQWLQVSAALTGLKSHRVSVEASTLPTALLLRPDKAQAACGDPRPPRRAKSIRPSVERLSWYHFQWEVFSQAAGSQQGGM